MSKPINPAELQAALAQFSGTENYHRLCLDRKVRCTDGVKYLAEQAGAFWLVDLVASHQLNKKVAAEPFQLWELVVKKPGAIATCRSDSDAPTIVQQDIEYTDFPLASIKLYFIDGVLLLPGEY